MPSPVVIEPAIIDIGTRSTERGKFFGKTSIQDSNPKVWWNEVKRISGNTAIKSSNLISKLEFVDNEENLSPTDIANQINKAFLEPMNEYSPLEAEVPSPNSTATPLSVSVLSTFNKLKSLNPGKSPEITWS